ncbi:PhzF family phenazine biosynthesis protein [Streptomyces tanashiensis]|uniref:PhzF family phenazine biosynthesis protein n=1 Tax=Streptomyces tanashiensis TaxID=67367 RepID=A0ABY6R2V4_9ACTN|nr:PhzF family phenazine biosynthesis protein [Streptomyces tanashiensis]UZX23917.1 PhzF family phenazine biosynthesis protein [Streptomyces tanashiensis]
MVFFGDPSATLVHACVRDGRGGSPTAVLDDGPFGEEVRRRVPGEAGASHAVFVSPCPARDGLPVFSLRFFTSEGELPSCGHGTVAALGYLAARAGTDAYRVFLRVAGRTFPGWAERKGAYAEVGFAYGPVELREPAAGESELVLPALGLAPDTLGRPETLGPNPLGPDTPGRPQALAPGTLRPGVRVASVGRPRLLVPVASRSGLAALAPDMERLRAACDRLGLLGCYVYSVPSPAGRVAARMFAPSIGVPEDIANANSTACLAAHLAGRGIGRIAVDMGDSLGSPATISATTRDGVVRLGGGVLITRPRP